jgi:hypothetical protein
MDEACLPQQPGKGEILAKFGVCEGSLPPQTPNFASFSRPLGGGQGWGDRPRLSGVLPIN